MSLEEIVSSPHVWRGRAAHGTRAVVPTGFETLDRILPGGGWPWGAVIEVFAEQPGVGELGLWMPALAAAARGEGANERVQAHWIVLVAAPWVPYPPAWSAAGIELDRVLLVESVQASRDVLWAVEQAVRSGTSVAVLAWLGEADDTALRRLQLAAEERGCGLVLFRPGSARKLRSPAALRLEVAAEPGCTRVEILKCRGGAPARVELDIAPPVWDTRRAAAGLGTSEALASR